ncbi:MAG TPA: NHLP leader peptide family RiPP precursor [Opitutus sp.]|nr:NHLP leader peptide family RiPP precursor [Opitutus sp.]
MSTTTNIDQEKWSRLVAQCWMNPQFQARLLRDPQSVLAEAGITLPAGVKVQVIAESPTQRTLVIPAPPPAGDVQDVLQARKAAAVQFLVG